MVLEQMDIHMQKQKNLILNFIPSTKIKSKWIIYLTIKCKTIRLLKENLHLGLEKNFLDGTP